jgi:hypothetical protein
LVEGPLRTEGNYDKMTLVVKSEELTGLRGHSLGQMEYKS